MKILTKLATALRGGLTEAGEAAVRTQSGRILDQEIRDADTAINESNSRLADTMADRADANRRIAKLQADISQYEGHANTALDKGKDELAGEIAAKIAEAEAQLNQEQQVAERLETAISSLHARIRESKHAIRVIKNKRNVAKATAQVRKATTAAGLSADGSANAIDRAAQTLRDIEQREQRDEDRAQAARQLHDQDTGADLERRMREAGITPSSTSGADVLARLRAKKRSPAGT